MKRRLVYVALRAANRVVPKSASKVVLHSSIDVQDGILSVVEELAARGRSAIVLLENPARAPLLRSLLKTPVEAVPKHSARGVWHFLTARYAMTTHNIYGNVASPTSQVLVNLWHGEPGAKVTARFLGSGPVRGTYAPVCSAAARALRSAAFDIEPLRVPIIGAPRNDRMMRADPGVARRIVVAGHTGPAFLWLPSFRVGRWGSRSRVDVAETPRDGLPYSDAELRLLDDWLVAAGVLVVVKPHPRDAARFDGSHRAIRVLRNEELHQHGLTVYTILPAFDGLITDVSSVWVDYLLLDKPLVFAFPDIDAYREGRGLMLEPYEHWVPGPFTRTIKELISALNDLCQGLDPAAEERSNARRRLHRYHDDQSAARLLDGLGLGPVKAPAPRG